MRERETVTIHRATVATAGLKLLTVGLLATIKEKVKIAQKTIKHMPRASVMTAIDVKPGCLSAFARRSAGFARVFAPYTLVCWTLQVSYKAATKSFHNCRSCVPSFVFHSYRSAIIGSTLAARRAGT